MKIAVNLLPEHAPFAGPSRDIDKLAKYCQQLGVDQLASWPDGVPGYKEKGYFTLEDLNRYKKVFEDRGMNIVVMSILGEYGMGNMFKKGLTRPPEDLCQMIEATGEAGIEVINLFPFSRSGGLMGEWAKDEKKRVEEWKRIVGYQQELVEHAEKAHVKLAYHQSWMPDGYFWNYESQKAFLDAVPSKYVGVNFCVGSNQLSNDDPPMCIRRFGEKIFLVHARDVKKSSWKGKVKATGEKWENWEKERYVSAMLGEGECDWPRVMDALKDIGYRGVILIEHIPRVVDEKNHEMGIAYAIGYLKGLLANLNF